MKLKDWDENGKVIDYRAAKRKKAADSSVTEDTWEDSGLDMEEEWGDSEPDAEGGWGEDWLDSDAEDSWGRLETDRDAGTGREKSRLGTEADDAKDRHTAEPDKDGQWKEAVLEAKPHVAYKWKNVALETDTASGTKREEPVKASGMNRKKRPQDSSAEKEDWEEELEPLKPWAIALIFVGLAVLAAIICAVLWRVTHSDRPEGNAGQDPSAQVSQESDSDVSGQASEPDLEPSSGDGQEGGDASDQIPDSLSGPDSEQNEDSGAVPDPEGGEGTGASEEPSSQAPSEPEEQEPVAGTASMTFQAVQESVTPKDVVNLRSVPTTADAENIVVQVQNGETLVRIGINQDTGWSKIDYNGQSLYAVSQYLTTDLSYRPPVQSSDPNRISTISGRIIIFRNCDDWITPKEYVNLRTEPSTTEGQATVSCQLNSGEKAHRTGYSTDSGWSRVEYNGQVLYVVTSLVREASAE